MRILERRTYLGPNLYAHFRVIRFLLDLGPLEEIERVGGIVHI